MTHNLKYPVLNCHFCNSVIIYQRYDNGYDFAHCNSHLHSSCMAFTYVVIDGCVAIQEFRFSSESILSFIDIAVTKESGITYCRTAFSNSFGDRMVNERVVDIDMNLILGKEDTIQLIDGIRCSVMPTN